MFIEPYFYWKGKSCKDYFLSIVSTGSSDILNEIGVSYSSDLSIEENCGYIQFTEQTSETDDIVLELCLEKDNIALVWTNEIFNEISKWLLSDDFEKFVSYDNLDYHYYFKCTKIVKKFNFERKGVIEVTFKPLNHYAYKDIEFEKIVKGKEFINIYNESDDKYEPIIIIENHGTEKTINKINDFEITDLKENESVIIDNYMLTVQNSKNENVLYKCNRNWVVLNKGENQLLVEGNCKVIILCEFPKII